MDRASPWVSGSMLLVAEPVNLCGPPRMTGRKEATGRPRLHLLCLPAGLGGLYGSAAPVQAKPVGRCNYVHDFLPMWPVSGSQENREGVQCYGEDHEARFKLPSPRHSLPTSLLLSPPSLPFLLPFSPLLSSALLPSPVSPTRLPSPPPLGPCKGPKIHNHLLPQGLA